jgi:hypothetical protein
MMMMEAARSSETLINFYQTHGAATQKTAIFLSSFAQGVQVFSQKYWKQFALTPCCSMQ